MPFPNVNDILATTIENRSRKTADNVTKNNAFLMKCKQSGRIRTFSGGHKIFEELTFAENANGGWYSGYDFLPIAAQDVISAAEFEIKQYAVPVVLSGLEMLQNAGREKMIDLMETRLSVAEATMANQIAAGLYSDGTGSSGKELTGLDAALAVDPSVSATYGGINQQTWPFWRNQATDTSGLDASTIQGSWNTLWAKCVRGSDRPDLVLVDNTTWGFYVASLQALQRFTNPETGALGFPSLKFMTAEVVLDGGIGDLITNDPGIGGNTAFFINSKYFHYRPHSARNMVPLSPNRRYATNQDAEVQILAWAGNLTCSGRQFSARWDNNA